MLTPLISFFSLVLAATVLQGQEPQQTASPSPQATKSKQAPAGMVFIPGGTYRRGSDHKFDQTRAEYPEESPVHEVTVDGFWIDATEVTNRQFLKFTNATGYKTQAERGWDSKDFPNAPPEQLKGGALLFKPTPRKVELFQPGAEWQWWQFVRGANWQHPEGPSSSIANRMDHPVVCATHEDAVAYCEWAGKRLPTEAEWERAARGGLDDKLFSWGDEPKPGNKWQANVYQGEFPNKNTAEDGFPGTAPVKSFPPNAYGLYDMAGNVWEHCSDLYRPDYYKTFAKLPEPKANPKGPEQPVSQPMVQQFLQTKNYPAEAPFHRLAWLWVTKGGSHLCHHTYCLRYRPAARHYSESLSPTNHTGFRCVRPE